MNVKYVKIKVIYIIKIYLSRLNYLKYWLKNRNK